MTTETVTSNESHSNSFSRTTRRVSVIIPCYNQAQYLGQAIECVLAQTFQDFEIIVVDDGSTDNTREVSASFGKSVSYIHQSNSGLSAARNTGIRTSTGNYLSFLDADDLWCSDFLATLVPLLDKDQQFGAVYCGSRFVDEEAKLLPQIVTRNLPPDHCHDALIDGEFFPVHAVLVRKAVFTVIGMFDEMLRASEDWDMWLRISAQYPFAGTPQALALYRMHGKNMTRDVARMRESQLHVVRKHFGAGEGDPANWPAERRRACAGIYLWQALALYQDKGFEAALEYLKLAFMTWPDLTRSLGTFYSLGCANQPPGYVGDVETLTLDQNGADLLKALNAIFADPSIPLQLQANSRLTYAMAYFALGILAYRKQDLGQARAYLTRAVRQSPGLIRNSQWLVTFTKTCLGSQFLRTLKVAKASRSSSRRMLCAPAGKTLQ